MRRIHPEILQQGINEAVPYAVVTTKISSNPTEVEFSGWDVSTNEDVTNTVFAIGEEATIYGDTITLPVMSGITFDHIYRIDVSWAAGAARYGVYFYVRGER